MFIVNKLYIYITYTSNNGKAMNLQLQNNISRYHVQIHVINVVELIYIYVQIKYSSCNNCIHFNTYE